MIQNKFADTGHQYGKTKKKKGAGINYLTV